MISGIQYPFDIVGSTDCRRPNVFVASQSSINGENGHDDDHHHHHYLVTLCQRHCQSHWFLWTLTTDSIAEVANMFSSKKSAFSANRIKAQHLSWVFSLYVCIVLAKSWPHVKINQTWKQRQLRIHHYHDHLINIVYFHHRQKDQMC